MKNNFEEKQNNSDNPKYPQEKLNRREFIKKILIGFGIGTIIYFLKILSDYKKNNKNESYVSNLFSQIENFKKEIDAYLQKCNDYHKFVNEKINIIESNINNLEKQKEYIENLEEYLEILNYIDIQLNQLINNIEVAIDKINDLNIPASKAFDLKEKLIKIGIKINETQKTNSKIIGKILLLKLSIKEKSQKNLSKKL